MTMKNENKGSQLLLLGGVLILALIFRIINLGGESLWFDEALSYLAASLSPLQIWSNAIQSSHPPLYYFFLHYWQQVVPDQDTFLRTLGVFWDIALILATYALSLALFRKRNLALFTALLIAISPFHVLYSQELRMYTQLMLFVVLGTLGYWQGKQTGRRIWWLLFGASFVLALYTHYFAVWTLGAIGFHALLHYREKAVLQKTVLVSTIVGALMVPWVWIVWRNIDPKLGALRPLTQTYSLDPLKPLTTLVFLIFGKSNYLWYTGFAMFAIVALGAVLLLDWRRIRREGTTDNLVLVLLIIVTGLAGPLLIYFVHPYFLTERTMAATSPFLFIILGWGLSKRQSPLPYLVGFTTVILVIGTILYPFQPANKPPYRDVVNWIAQNRQANDVILHTSDGSYWPALRYVNWPYHVVLAGDPDPRRSTTVHRLVGGDVWTQEQVLEHHGRLWLVVALEHSVEWQVAQSDYFSKRYHLLDKQEIGGVQVYLYDPIANVRSNLWSTCQLSYLC